MRIEVDLPLPCFALKEYPINFYVDEENTRKYNTIRWIDYFYTPKEIRQLKLEQIESRR